MSDKHNTILYTWKDAMKRENESETVVYKNAKIT